MAKRTRDEPPEARFDGVLGGSRGYGLPAVRTLSDEYRDVAEPEDSDRVPAPDPPGGIERLVVGVRNLVRRDRTTSR
jgi:hypothetical protein